MIDTGICCVFEQGNVVDKATSGLSGQLEKIKFYQTNEGDHLFLSRKSRTKRN